MKEKSEPKKNQVVLITGASSGIGQAIANFLTEKGLTVFGTARAPEKHSAPGFPLLPLDVRDDDSVKRCVDEVIKRAGKIDVLVNNAGFALYGGLEETTLEQAKAIFETNFFGAMRMTNQVLPLMRARQSGRIINVGSVVGFIPAPYMGIYAATKHALEGYSESLDHETRTLGVRVVVVEPGFTKTQIDQNVQVAAAPLPAYENQRNRIIKTIDDSISSGSDPVSVAEVVARIIKTDNPKPRYPVGGGARLLQFLRGIMPSRIFDQSLRKQFKLDAK